MALFLPCQGLGIILSRATSLPVTVDDLRSLNPYAVEFRYDDEIVPTMTCAELDTLLSTILRWAQQCVAGWLADGKRP
jgi:hypothetical protein